ncbi:LysM peptidoglycan-binding domain-containing protein [Cytophagales bacterium RKSG123]|nr:LysM peptidoglycan-binding domain-containing protein [Xanthovirga aplysinae]
MVLVDKWLRINEKWLKAQPYYKTWDSWNINPYKEDIQNLEGKVNLHLYNENIKNWAFPVRNTYVTSGFGLRHYRMHNGVDLKVLMGAPVYSAFDGVVRIVKYDRNGYGNYIVVRHANGLETLYGHLKKALVKVGQEVKVGERIGLGGNTGRSSGTHLHFEVRYLGYPFDPRIIYDLDTDTLKKVNLELDKTTFAYLKEARKIVFHRIRSGDTLSGISKRYRTSVKAICRLNGISSKTILRIGRKLRIR